jgi:hypothetical protein
MSRISWLLFSLPLAVGGCLSMDGAWESQRQALITNPDPVARANSLAVFAASAGSIGDSTTVKLTLNDLAADPRHDEVAEQCAIQLGNGGHWLAAIEVAGLVKDEAKRKEALFKVRGW